MVDQTTGLEKHANDGEHGQTAVGQPEVRKRIAWFFNEKKLAILVAFNEYEVSLIISAL